MPILADTFAFLAELEQHNEREWFKARKDRYEAARKDVAALSGKLMDAWSKLEPIPPQDPLKTLYRIYRDVRFSANKDPYKAWFSFYIKRGPGRVGLFVHVRPGDRGMFGTGVYDPSKEQLAAIRQEIDYNADALRKVLGGKRFKDAFGELQGAQLKRAPKGYAVDDPNIDLLNYKQLIVTRTVTDADYQTAGIEKRILADFKKAKPFMDFLDAPLQEALEKEGKA
jgi:uncharacterized protein (TIGR02453 family)